MSMLRVMRSALRSPGAGRTPSEATETLKRNMRALGWVTTSCGRAAGIAAGYAAGALTLLALMATMLTAGVAAYNRAAGSVTLHAVRTQSASYLEWGAEMTAIEMAGRAGTLSSVALLAWWWARDDTRSRRARVPASPLPDDCHSTRYKAESRALEDLASALLSLALMSTLGIMGSLRAASLGTDQGVAVCTALVMAAVFAIAALIANVCWWPALASERRARVSLSAAYSSRRATVCVTPTWVASHWTQAAIGGLAFAGRGARALTDGVGVTRAVTAGRLQRGHGHKPRARAHSKVHRGGKWGLCLLVVVLLALLPSGHAHSHDPWAQYDEALGLRDHSGVYLQAAAFSAVVPVVVGHTRLMLTNIQQKMSTSADRSTSMANVEAETSRHAADITFMTETGHKAGRTGRLRGFKTFWSAGKAPQPDEDEEADDAGVSGCAIAISEQWIASRPVRLVSKQAAGRGLVVKVQQRDATWLYLVAIYAPASRGTAGSERRREVRSLAKWLSKLLRTELLGRKVILAGDMNTVLRAIDRRSKKLTAYDRDADCVPQLMKRHDYSDISTLALSGEEYTTQYKTVNGATTGTSRIDQIYASPTLVQSQPALVGSKVKVANAAAIHSTHKPVLMDLPCLGPVGTEVPEEGPRISYKYFHAAAKRTYKDLLESPEAAATMEGITDKVRQASELLDAGQEDRATTRLVFDVAWAEWTKLITTAITDSIGVPQRRVVEREECDGRRATRAASMLVGVIDDVLDKGRHRQSLDLVRAAPIARIEHQIHQLHRWVPEDKRVRPFRGSTWGSLLRWGPLAKRDAERARVWGRKAGAAWMSASIKKKVRARRSKLFNSGMGSLIASGLQVFRVASRLGSAPDVVHAAAHKCIYGEQPVTCGCYPNALENRPARTKELIKDHFHRWTRPPSGGLPAMVEMRQKEDGRKEYHARPRNYTVERNRQARTARATERAIHKSRNADWDEAAARRT